MKSVDTLTSPLELAPPQAGDAMHKDLRTQNDRRAQAGHFDALLAEASDHEAAAGKRAIEPVAKKAPNAVDDRANTLPVQHRSIHDSITRTTRGAAARTPGQSPDAGATTQSADSTNVAAQQASHTPATSAVASGDDSVTGLEFDDAVQPDGGAQALQAVLGQVASVVAAIVAPAANVAANAAAQQTLAATAGAATNPQQTTDTPAASAASATADAQTAASATSSDTFAQLMTPGSARSANPLAQTAAEVPGAKALVSTLTASPANSGQPAQGAVAAVASTPAAIASAQGASVQSATSAQSAATTGGAVTQSAGPQAQPAQPAEAAPAQAGAPASVAKPGVAGSIADAATPGQQQAASNAAVAVSAAPLAVPQQTLPAAADTSSAREPRGSAKATGANDDRIQGFTRGALGGSVVSAYAGRAQTNADQQSSMPSKHAEDLDEQEDHDSKVDAASGFNVVPMVLPDPANAQLAAAPVEAPRMSASMPQPAVPVPTPAAPLAQVEFAARAPGAQTENASISIHHPDLGPIQLEVHRDHGRVEVHAVIESLHAEAVLRANESGIRQGVQQSGMTFSALRVRVRGEEQPTARPAQPRKRRANERE